MKFWAFNANTCRFERTAKQAALHTADVAVVNDDTDMQTPSSIISRPSTGSVVSRWSWLGWSSIASCSSRYIYIGMCIYTTSEGV